MRLREGIVTVLVCACSSVAPAASRHHVARVTSFQNYAGQVADVIRKLGVDKEKGIPEKPGTSPSLETQRLVWAELLGIARQSQEGRTEVIRVLIKIVDGPIIVAYEPGIATRWRLAVDLLGEIGAVEAINHLIDRLDKTGLPVPITPMTPPARTALIRIGTPAVPRLIQSLAFNEGQIRLELIRTLVGIGRSAVQQLEVALSDRAPSVRGGAAIALGWIAGEDAMGAINRALASETDAAAKKDLQFALNEIMRLR